MGVRQRMRTDVAKRLELEAQFHELGIDYSAPGFYDHPSFAEAEKKNGGEFLQLYAEYIESLSLTDAYLAKAKPVILRAAQFLHTRLVDDGQKGVCLDVTGVLSRFLEREGVWNYVVKGALTVVFDRKTGFRPTHMAPVMMSGNPAVLGHAWLCAPPYRIVDIAFSCQKYDPAEAALLKGIVTEESPGPATPEPTDIFDPDAHAHFARQLGRSPTMRDVNRVLPWLQSNIERFGAFRVMRPHLVLKYVACCMTAFDRPLEGVTNIRLQGKLPIDIFREYQETFRPAPVKE